MKKSFTAPNLTETNPKQHHFGKKIGAKLIHPLALKIGKSMPTSQ
jgi:hypothetical protein